MADNLTEQTTTGLCGEFAEPTNPDLGQPRPVSILPSAEKPAVAISGLTASTTFINDEPIFIIS